MLTVILVFEDEDRAHAATEAVEKEIHHDVGHHEKVNVSETTSRDQV